MVNILLLLFLQKTCYNIRVYLLSFISRCQLEEQKRAHYIAKYLSLLTSIDGYLAKEFQTLLSVMTERLMEK